MNRFLRAIKSHIQKKPELSFYFVLVFFISADGLIVPIGRAFTVPQVAIILFALFYLLKLINTAKKPKNHYLLAPRKQFTVLVFWFLFLVISVLLMPDNPLYHRYGLGLLQSYGVVSYMYLFWILLNLFLLFIVFSINRDESNFIITLKLTIISSFVFSVYGIYQYFMAEMLGESASSIVYSYNDWYLYYDYIVRLLSFSREPLYFANYISCILIINLTILITGYYKKISLSKNLLLVITLSNVVAFYLTKSTGGFISFVVASFIVMAIVFKDKWKSYSKVKLASYSVIFMGIIGAFFLSFQRQITRRLDRLIDPESGYTRVVSIIEGVEMTSIYPWFGFGLGNSNFFISVTQIHNAYLNMLAETGIFTFILFIVFLFFLNKNIYLSYKISNQHRPLVIALFGGLIVILVQWLSFFAYMILFAWFIFGLILALPHVIRKLEFNEIAQSLAKSK